MIIFPSEIQNSTEIEPFHRHSPAKKKKKKDSYKDISLEEESSLKDFHIRNCLKPLFKN